VKFFSIHFLAYSMERSTAVFRFMPSKEARIIPFRQWLIAHEPNSMINSDNPAGTRQDATGASFPGRTHFPVLLGASVMRSLFASKVMALAIVFDSPPHLHQ
jgi:hypothetical protein